MLMQKTQVVDFSFTGFNSSDILLYGNATIDSGVLSLTRNTTFSIGRALYNAKVHTRYPNSSNLLPFTSSFTFSISPYKDSLPGHGFVLIFVPSTGIEGASSSQHLGFLNSTNDVSYKAGYWLGDNTKDDSNNTNWSFKEVKLNIGANYQVWIEYWNYQLSITLAPENVKKPERPLIQIPLDLSDVFLDDMYVGAHCINWATH
ncbi:hypothetical protein L3X38_023351 [Prunus dulcis]|uniref:Legume lectin domain-containing protein n=1 Tax=Prunus dulcis TaxID=3755 RepID=A0AAD4VYM3_PRUDU|nr:hypothetical protein L3X38_023351 [Prunus dulcis]